MRFGGNALVDIISSKGIGKKLSKYCVVKKRRLNGRNNTGKITIRGRGGGMARSRYVVDVWRRFYRARGLFIGLKPKSKSGVMYGLVYYGCGLFTYFPFIEVLQNYIYLRMVCWTFISCFRSPFSQDISNYFLLELELGSVVNNIIPVIKESATLATAPGTFARLINVKFTRRHSLRVYQNGMFSILLPSGRLVYMIGMAKASQGVMGNRDWNLRISGNAGQSRKLGRRPMVRGVAKNPVDHPHGGQTSGGRCSVSPWGWLTKGVPTRTRKRRKRYSIVANRFNRALF